MKSATLLALSAALAPAAAGVHKTKLQKISLDEQLKTHTMHDMTKMLGNKYQRLSPLNRHMQEMFAPQGGHKLPVTNYMNAQC
jgi:saccharopepsin